MKTCVNCDLIYEDNVNFCKQCGAKTTEIQPEEEQVISNDKSKLCSNCGLEILDEQMLFCSRCGKKLNDDVNLENGSLQKNIENAFEKIKDNDFVSSVKNDVNNSQSLNIVKSTMKSTFNKTNNALGNIDKSSNLSKLLPICAITIVMFIITVVVATNYHTCEECGKEYFGKEYTISFWGESAQTCEECYNEFYYGW